MKTKSAIFSLFVLILINSTVFADADPNFYLYLCFGQSNMESGSQMSDIDRQPVDERFQVLADFDNASRGWTKGNWYKADAPITARGRGFNLVDYFGRTMVANLPKNIRIGIVKCSVSGTKMELWDKDEWKNYLNNLPPDGQWKISAAAIYQPSPYQFLVDQAKIAQKDGVIKGILIHQGESNFEDPNWPKKVKKIYGDLMTDLNLKPENVSVFAGEVVNADQQGEKAAFNEILKKLPETLPNSYVISSAGVPCNPDHLHFNSLGNREFGRRYAEKALSVLGYKATEPKEPYVKPAAN